MFLLNKPCHYLVRPGGLPPLDELSWQLVPPVQKHESIMIGFSVGFTVETTHSRCQRVHGFRRHRCPEALSLVDRACWVWKLILCVKIYAGPVSWTLDNRRPGRLV